MFRSYYWILHLVMIAAGAYFTADIANLALGAYWERSLDIPKQFSASQGDRESRSEDAPSTDVHYILTKNIFNSKAKPFSPTRQGDVDPTAATPVAVALPPLNLTLVGTVIPKHATPYAVFSEANNQEQRIYRLGDLVGENAKLIEIERHQTVILRGDKKEVVELAVDPKDGQSPAQPIARRVAPAPPAPTPTVGDTIRQVSENQWVLDRREIDNAMSNLPQLLTKARIIPNFKDGKPDGFRIFAISQDSLYAKIGLNNGDILNRINGIDVKDPQNFMKVLEQLKDENSIHIDLVRNNQKQTFDYEIR